MRTIRDALERVVDRRLGGPNWRSTMFVGTDWWVQLPDPIRVPVRVTHPRPNGYVLDVAPLTAGSSGGTSPGGSGTGLGDGDSLGPI